MQPPPAQRETPTEAQLRVALALKNMQQAIMQCCDAVFFMDGTGVLNRVNPAFEELTGYGQLEIVGRDLSRVIAGGAHSSGYHELWRRLFEDHSFSGQVDILQKGGRSQSARLKVTAMRDREGKIKSLVGTARPDDPGQSRPSGHQTSLGHMPSATQDLVHDLNNQLMVIATRADILASACNSNPEWARQVRDIHSACAGAIRRIHEFIAVQKEDTKSKAQAASM